MIWCRSGFIVHRHCSIIVMLLIFVGRVLSVLMIHTFFICLQSSPIKCCLAGVFVCMNISSSFCSFALSYVSVMPIMLKFPFQKIWLNMHWLIFPKLTSLLIKDVSAQPAFTCSKLIIETLEQGVKYVQS